VPVGTSVHVPSDAASAHDSQVPVHAVAQQIPCWHSPVMHSLPAPHVRPVGFLVQTPATQTFGAPQSASPVHDVRQTSAAHTYVPHDDGVVVWQVPVPLHVRAGVNVAPLQLAATQTVPPA